MAAVPAVAYDFIYCKRSKRQKFLALIISDGNYEGKILINKCMKEDLRWWQHNASIKKNPIRLKKFQIELSSDASLTGLGTHCEGKSANGFWSKLE